METTDEEAEKVIAEILVAIRLWENGNRSEGSQSPAGLWTRVAIRLWENGNVMFVMLKMLKSSVAIRLWENGNTIGATGYLNQRLGLQ